MDSDMPSFSGFFDYRRLYEFADPLTARPYRLRSRLPLDALTKQKRLHLLTHGNAAGTEPIQFDAAQGEEATDILWTQLVRPVCISGRLIRLLQENEIRGWSTYPVELFDPCGIRLSDYYGLAVTGAVCEADYSRSAVATKPPPTPRGRSYDVYKGLYFDEDHWDGSDMFWVGGVRVIVDKVKKLFEQNKVKNVRFIPLSEREIRVRHVRQG